MLKDFKNKNATDTHLEFNHDYDVELIRSNKGIEVLGHLTMIYPKVLELFIKDGILEAYVEPKVKKYIEIEREYLDQGYPSSGAFEIAFKDLNQIIKEDLQPLKEKEFYNSFDMDLNTIIDTENN